MSNIDKKALRDIAEKTKIAGEAPVMPFEQRINALNDFTKHFTPATVLALLDELEAKEEQRADWFQMAQKLGEDLDAAEKRIAELREWNAGLEQESFTYQQRVAELQSVNDELTKFPDQIVSYVAKMGTSEIGWQAKDVIYRAAQKVKDRAAGIGKGE